MAQNKHTVFDQIEFPPYEFREFPMAVPIYAETGEVAPTPYNERGKSHPVVLVQNQAELDALMGPGVTLVPVGDGSSRLQTEADIRAELYEQAETRGVFIDKNWPVERIQAVLNAPGEVV